MSGKESTAKQYWLPVLGLVFLLLFTFQMKGNAGLPCPPVIKRACVSSLTEGQRHNIWQVQESDYSKGLVPDCQLTLAATVVFFLLLSIPFPSDNEKALPLLLPFSSRNFSCIVPKGP